MSLKAVILVGGAQKGTRFRPLSDLSLHKKCLFSIAGIPLIEHHIGFLCELENLSEILLLGFYPADEFTNFIDECRQKYRVPVRYLYEGEPLGTAGGLLKFEDEILAGNPKAAFVLNADVCGDLPVTEMVQELDSHSDAQGLLLTTEATREQSINFGCVVLGLNGKVLHYVDKPTTFITSHISCGIYLLRPQVWKYFHKLMRNGQVPSIWFETDIFPDMALDGTLHALWTTRWWSQAKNAAAALYANGHYLRLYQTRCPERLATGPNIIGDVFIDPTAEVHPTAKIGPNVSIEAGAKIGPGVRIRESIILPECVLKAHCCVLYSVVGWRSIVGAWARIEGTPISPNPNIPFAKLDNKPLFNENGRLNPSLTILGSDVNVSDEQVILNTVVLPYKDLSCSYKNQIIL
uniref:Nucleotidyl transferase domain-containing protein n=1 Tax=Panagrolaimus sp. JU765 TaxID=591449 RepID=A0AC34QYA2_9BILA